MTPEELAEAKLPSQWRYCHNNGYNLYNLDDVVALHKKKFANDPSFKIQQLKKDLKAVRSQVRSLEKDLKEKHSEEIEIANTIKKLGGSAEEPKRKRKTKAKASAKKAKEEEEEEEEEEVQTEKPRKRARKATTKPTNENTTAQVNGTTATA